jgi:hypothetical protein
MGDLSGVKLYQIADEFVAAMAQLDEAGFDEQTIADTMEGFAGTFEEKAANVIAWIENISAEADAIKAHIAKLKTRMEHLNKSADSMREYLKVQMLRTDMKKLMANGATVSVRNNPPSVKIADGVELPEIFLREIPATFEPDKKAIKEALENGKQVPGCSLVRTTSLMIK